MHISQLRFGRSILVGCWVLLSAERLAAGPPLSIDDPGILDPRQVEFILAGEFEDSDAGTSYALPIVDISIGVSANTQMSVVATRVAIDPDNGESRSDFGPAAIGVKWRFLKREQLEMSVAPFFEALPGDGAADRGIIEDINAWTLPVQAQYNFARWRLNAEIGYSAIHDADDEWAYGVAATRPLGESLEVMAEIHGGVLKDFDDHGMLYRIGLDWGALQNFHVLLSLGSSIRDSGDEELDLQGYVGLQWFH
jgi:hypothetical protein